jgi:molybdenum cofactor guanylyltransferase
MLPTNHNGSPDKPVAIVLAGGRSRRFGSDKVFAELQGRTLTEWVIAAAEDAGFHVMLSGPADKLQQFGRPIIEDDHPYEGPLSVLRHLWTQTPTDRILLLPCDMPRLSPRLLAEMWKASLSYDALALESTSGKPAPLPGIYCRSTFSTIEHLLTKGRRDMRALFKTSLRCKVLKQGEIHALVSDNYELANMNALGDLVRAQNVVGDVSS